MYVNIYECVWLNKTDSKVKTLLFFLVWVNVVKKSLYSSPSFLIIPLVIIRGCVRLFLAVRFIYIYFVTPSSTWTWE